MRLTDELAFGLIADALAYGGEPVDDPVDDDTTLIVEAFHRINRIAAAVKHVQTHYRERLAARIDLDGDFRYGDTIYRVSPRLTRRVLDDRGLLEWLGDDLMSAVNASDVKITAVRAIAKSRDMDSRAVEDTFFFVERGDPELASVPIDRAPAFLQKMGEGTHWRKRDKK